MACLLFQILMQCAEAIEGGRLDDADSFLERIQSLASQEASKSTRKVAKYCAEALVRRAYGIRPLCPLRLLFTDLSKPFLDFALSSTEDAIAGAWNPRNKRLHIIDLSIMSDIWRWTAFIALFKGRCVGRLQSVLITSFTSKLLNHSDQSSQERVRKVVGDVNLEWRQLIYSRPDDIVKKISKLRRKRKDDMVVVSWHFILRKLLAQDGAIEQVLSKVKDLKADIMVIFEQEANLNSPDLSKRLQQSLQYYSTVFESLEQDDDTFISWKTSYFRRQIGNVVACEGIDRVERIESFDQWQHRLSQAGFCPVPLQARYFTHGFRFLFEKYGIKHTDGHIQLCWDDFPLAVGSAWKLTDPPQSSSGPCVMQDVVDDPEEMASSSEYEDTLGYWKNMLAGLCVMQDVVDDSEEMVRSYESEDDEENVDDPEEMASSSESEDDEENDPCIMADRNLWSTQGCSMNRIAASAELFDIMEYLCHLYKLQAAVTWISDNRGGNTNSNEKRILCIDYSACYTLIPSINDFVGGYAHLRLEEGQGVAGKALQSNFHIQHDVYEPDPADFYDSDNESNWQNRTFHASFAIRLTSTHSCKDDYVLEFFLPEEMKEISEQELLISKVLRTLQKNCLESWKVWVRELNEASDNGVRLDDERISSIPHEAVLGENEFMTFNSTNNQAGETHEPPEQVLFFSDCLFVLDE
ncbi:hypothetical protein OIU85_000210 [Salix viminalis]|uniref:NLP1-9 GAF domain-containing protein n=1 Tax=Salix viminalis TaxID=40686 RepID=A0A9Q0ZWJ4_SALVM|nr:hypothetical protein OIU85_000210 [Salix viminalis]